MGSHLVVDVHRSTQDLQTLRAEWLELLPRTGQNEPTLGPDWTLAWWRTFGELDGRELRLVCFREGGRLVGLAPLLRRLHRYAGLLPFRRLEALCSGEAEEDEVFSEYLGLVAERGREDDVAGALVRAVEDGALGATDEVLFPRVDGASPSTPALVAAFRASGWQVSAECIAEAPYAALPGSWEDYLAAMPQRRRKGLRRSLRELERWAGAPLRLEVAESEAGRVRGRAILESLHGQRWAGAGRAGVFASDRFRRFHDEVMPLLARNGQLELAWLEARGEPIAALYNIVWGDRVYVYQSGRRIDLPPALRPGIVVHACAIQRSIELGRQEYDFLGGATAYKLEFAQCRRRLVDVRAARPGGREGLRRLLGRMHRWSRRLRHGRPVTEAAPEGTEEA